MSKARLLADLLRDNKISWSEISGETSATYFNKDESTYENKNSLRTVITDLQDEIILELGV